MDFLIPFFTADFLGKPAWVWLTFVGIVIALLAFDLGVLHKDDKEIGVRESLLLSAGYISVALLFGAWVWWFLGAQSGMDYYTGFMIEKSLSMDNVFVIALIFSFFAIPRQYQHRVLGSLLSPSPHDTADLAALARRSRCRPGRAVVDAGHSTSPQLGCV